MDRYDVERLMQQQNQLHESAMEQARINALLSQPLPPAPQPTAAERLREEEVEARRRRQLEDCFCGNRDPERHPVITCPVHGAQIKIEQQLRRQDEEFRRRTAELERTENENVKQLAVARNSI